MRGTLILIVFFSLFGGASLLIPKPMPPGNLLTALTGGVMDGYGQILSALVNGIFYGVILWSVFILLSKRLGEER
jgi:TRAP-type C4-dicarboxylate transport system substrate-binding protein